MLKYAKKQVELKEEEIADLRDRLIGLGQAKELEKEILQKQLNDLKNEIHDLRERYETENSDLRTCVNHLSLSLNISNFIKIYFRKSSR
jgi:predicted  nucleic acid-binding Zn-ribbon protein